MIENLLQEIMSDEEFQELLIAVEHNKDYSFHKNGLDLDISNASIEMRYTEPVKALVSKFTDYCESLDDEIFVGICEFIGKDGLNRIQDCLDSDNIESVRGAIQYFKNNAKDFILDKIDSYQEVLDTL